MYSQEGALESVKQGEKSGSIRTNRSEGARVILQTSVALSFDALHPPSRLCPFGQIHPDQDLGSLPQLNDVDNIFQCGDGETDESDKFWPGKASNKGREAKMGR